MGDARKCAECPNNAECSGAVFEGDTPTTNASVQCHDGYRLTET